MGTTHQLVWGGLRLRRETLDMQTRRTTHHDPPLVEITGYTASEQARVMRLTKRELIKLIADAAAALEVVERAERDHPAAVAPSGDVSGSPL